ncbi:hypothetical protein DVH24_028857 [Malus domestica]|uniref:DNA topoisomerase (ATP-hydrolyzing) n=1 Tax=Malus domestica TaxID=3750 RepID=A0A498KN28_MALDO|nr:hypothetical protein DVH24_009276 [Malus domestica]RXI09540.1 hypothetical protein DVH24_028857 [Malus domestica]
MTSLNDDIVDLIKKRMIDIVGYLGVWRDVDTKSFSTYVDLYLKPRAFHFVNIPRKLTQSTQFARITMKISDDMEICVTLSDNSNSFVNLVNTSHGGDNVKVVSKAIAKHLFETIKEKDKNPTLNSDENENENQNLNFDEAKNPNL